MKISTFLHYANIPYHISNHVVGKQHTATHRRVAGVFVMAIGVFIAHIFAHAGNLFVVLAGDLVGYSIHGTGLIPFIQDVEKINDNQNH